VAIVPVAEQVYGGASFMSATELAMRDEVGVDRVMFGVDFALLRAAAADFGLTFDEVLHPAAMPTAEDLGRNKISFLRPPGL
jgi:hypothetical protein